MFGFGKRKKTGSEITFKKRVELFWAWYEQAGPQFLEAIESGNCPSLAPIVSNKIDELLPGFGWNFGPGEKGGHSFTLSGEGNSHLQLLSIYWRSLAPALPKWTFHAARQPGSLDGFKLMIGADQFQPAEFWFVPSINEEDKNIDLTIWHPLFAKMEEQDRWRVLFLILDELLGEYGTQHWIGQITMDASRLADSMPVKELPGFIEEQKKAHGWQKLPPGEEFILYQLSDPHDQFPRGDIVIGTTAHPKLLNDYLGSEGQFEDPFSRLGADFVYIEFDRAFLPKGREAEARGAIEEKMGQALKETRGGQCLGGATGLKHAYIDLLCLDGAASLAVIKQAAQELGLQSGASLHYFAREKADQSLVLN